jgi:hypothetical protein
VPPATITAARLSPVQPSEVFRLFIERSDELDRTRLRQGEMELGITFKVVDGHTEIAPRFPDEEDLRSYLVVFRHFLLQGEPVFLHHVFNLCETALTSEPHKVRARSARAGLKTATVGSGIALVYQEKNLTPEDALDLLLNGFYFHSDPKHNEVLAGLPSFFKPMVKHSFLTAVFGVSKVIHYTASLLRDALANGLVNDAFDAGGRAKERGPRA